MSPRIPPNIVDQYRQDGMVAKIHAADLAAGRQVSYGDVRRNKLAVARIQGIKNKWPDII